MTLRINDLAPDFVADTTQGRISFHAWMGHSWAVLFSNPRNVNPVYGTEIGPMAGLVGKLKDRNVKVIGISLDPVEIHLRLREDIRVATGIKVPYPLIGDSELEVAKLYDIKLTEPSNETFEHSTVSSVFVIGPDKKIELVLTYPWPMRSFTGILDAIDTLQMTANREASPTDWWNGFI